MLDGPSTRLLEEQDVDPRQTPEAPVPVVSVTAEEYRSGGAANVAMNLAALGIKTELIGCCGKDESATTLRNLLSAQGIRLPQECE